MRHGADIYLVTRVHGLRTHIIPARDITMLAKAKSLRDVFDSLMKTEYATELGQIPAQNNDAATLEGIFHRKLVDRFFFLSRTAQGKMQDLLIKYSARFEVENIKRIVRAKHGGITSERPDLIPVPREHSLVNFAALLNAKDIDEVASLLRDTPYHVPLDKVESYKQSGSTMVLEGALDSVYFSNVWELANKVRDGKGVRDLIGEEIDLRNLLIAFSLRAREIPRKVIEETIIPVFYGIPKATLHSLLQARLEDVPGILTRRYSRPAYEATNLLKSKSTQPFEWPFFRQLYSDASEAMRAHPLQAEYVLAYLLLCECETKNLVTIVTGKQLDLSEEEISKGLYEV
jgi:vacuolar-type H+-ATPase subunit C/Vma6